MSASSAVPRVLYNPDGSPFWPLYMHSTMISTPSSRLYSCTTRNEEVKD